MLLIKQSRFGAVPLTPAAPPAIALGGRWNPSSIVAGSSSVSPDGLTASVTGINSQTSTGLFTYAFVSAGKWYIELDLSQSLSSSNLFGFAADLGGTNSLAIDMWLNQIVLTSGSSTTTVGYPAGDGGLSDGEGGSDGVAVGYASNSTTITVGLALDMDRRQFWFRPSPITAWTGMTSGQGYPDSGRWGLNIEVLSTPVGLYVATLGQSYSAHLRSGGSVPMLGEVPQGFQPGWPVVSP